MRDYPSTYPDHLLSVGSKTQLYVTMSADTTKDLAGHPPARACVCPLVRAVFLFCDCCRMTCLAGGSWSTNCVVTIISIGCRACGWTPRPCRSLPPRCGWSPGCSGEHRGGHVQAGPADRCTAEAGFWPRQQGQSPGV